MMNCVSSKSETKISDGWMMSDLWITSRKRSRKFSCSVLQLHIAIWGRPTKRAHPSIHQKVEDHQLDQTFRSGEKKSTPVPRIFRKRKSVIAHFLLFWSMSSDQSIISLPSPRFWINWKSMNCMRHYLMNSFFQCLTVEESDLFISLENLRTNNFLLKQEERFNSSKNVMNLFTIVYN